MQVSAAGQLETSDGQAVLGNAGGPIAIPPYEKMEIGPDGTITILPVGQEATTLAVVDRIKLVKIPDEDIAKGVDGMLRNKREADTPPDATVQLEGGYLEGSNVSMIGSMVEMISLSRQYELQVKVMSTADQIARAGEGIMRLG